MSLFGFFSNCGISCCSERDERREQSQQIFNNSQNTNPDRVRQLIIDSQKQNNLTGSGTLTNTNQTTNQNDDFIDGFIEITPIFHGPKSGSGSGSEVDDDYCEIIHISRNSSSLSSTYSSGNQQVVEEFVSLPIKNSKRRRSDLLHGASRSGSQTKNDNGQQSYKASMRSRNSSQASSQEGSQTRLDKQTKRQTKSWTEEEDRLLRFYYSKHNGKWPAIANEMADRTASQCSQRWRRIKPSKIRRPWTPEEDVIVLALIKQHGKNWGLISSQMDNRSGKQVRERYINKLDPELNNNQFNEEEDRTIVSKYYKIGPKWSEIAKFLVGRSENMVKNRFYSFIKKSYAINSFQANRSDQNWQEPNSSPRLLQGDDKASSYASSLYNDLDPSFHSENNESEESSSEGEQYHQFSLGPNPNQHLGLVDDKNQQSFNRIQNHDDINQINLQNQQNQQLFNHFPIQQTENNFLQNQQQLNQQQSQQQQPFYTFNQDNSQQTGIIQNQNVYNNMQSNLSNSELYLKRNSQVKKLENEKVEEMFHTPRLALANNSSFFPTEMFIQQQRYEQEQVMNNSNGQQALGNNFFSNGAPSPLILLSPAQIKTEQFSFTSNTPGRRYMTSNQNTPYTQNNNQQNNMNSQTNSNVHFNFTNVATTPNYKTPNPQQQPQQFQNAQQQQYQQTNAFNHQNQLSSSYQNQNQPTNLIDSSNMNQQTIFSFQSNGQIPQQNQTHMANIKVNFEENFENLSIQNNCNNSNLLTPTQGINGQYYLPPISPQSTLLNDYQQQLFLQTTGDLQQQYQQQQHQQYQYQQQQQQQQQQQYYHASQQQLQQQQQQQYYQNQQNNVNQNLTQSNPREELRLDISINNKQDELQYQQGQYNNSNNQQLPLATPKINRTQLKSMIVDLESQLQLLKVRESFMNEDEYDN